MWVGTAMKCVLMVALWLSLSVVFQVQTGKRHRHRQVRKNTFTQIWSEILTRFLIQEKKQEVRGLTPGDVTQ